MSQLLKEVEDSFKAKKVTDVKSGDTVRVHQRIKEGSKERTQVFEGLVINTRRPKSATHTITVRRIASGVGVEKTFQMHSPLIEKIEVVKRSEVRRKKLTYMRGRSGKSARLAAVDFDSDKVNYVPDVEDKTEVKDNVVEEAQAKEIEEPEAEDGADEKPADKDEAKDADSKEEKAGAKQDSKDDPKAEKVAEKKTDDKK